MSSEIESPLVESSASSTDKVNKESLFQFCVLPFIKTIQNQNGLKRNEYSRYMKFLTRRIRRICIGLKLLHGNGKNYKKITFSVDMVRDIRIFELILLHAERAWATAMLLKEEKDNPRAKFHKNRRLRKAVVYSKILRDICTLHYDARTQLEAKAYSTWIEGMSLFERNEFEKVTPILQQAHHIFEKLSKVVVSHEQEYYIQRAEEVQTILRFCRSRTAESFQELLEASNNLDLKFLESKISEVLEETRRQQASTIQNIEWKGSSILIRSEKLRVLYLKCQGLISEQQSMDMKSKIKMDLFEKLFISISEMKQAIKDEKRRVIDEKKGEILVRELDSLAEFIEHREVDNMINRNFILIRIIEDRFEEAGFEDLNLLNPDELVRFYELQAQLYSDYDRLDHFEAFEAVSFALKGLRCFYLSLSYARANKWRESLALLKRSAQHSQASESLFRDKKEKGEKYLQERIGLLFDQIQSATAWIHATGYEDLIGNTTNEKEGSTSQDLVLPSFTHPKSILSDLKSWDASYVKEKVIMNLPPTLKPIPNKPFVFDLSLSHYSYPDLTDKKKLPKQNRFFGFFSRS